MRRESTMRSTVLAFVCLAAFAGTARANSITISYYAGDGCSGSASGSGTLSYDNHTSTASGCTGTSLGAFTNVQVVADSFQLKLLIDTTGTTDISGRSVSVQVSDLITITGGTGSGTLTVPWLFNGTLDGGPTYYSNLFMYAAFSSSQANFIACGQFVAFGSQFCGNTDSQGNVTPALAHEVVTNQVRTFDIPFTYGTPFQLIWYVSGVVGSGCSFGNSCSLADNTGSGTLDFYHTALLQPLLVYDASGALVSNALVTSDDGTIYPVASAVSAVPEPGSFLLLGSGVALLARRFRSRK